MEEVNKGKVPRMKTKYMAELVKGGQREMIVLVRAQNPPCSCNFIECLALAKESGANEHVQAYFQRALDLISKCDKEPTSTTLTADVVALIDQGADVYAKTSDERTPLLCACEKGLAEWPWRCWRRVRTSMSRRMLVACPCTMLVRMVV